MSTANLTAILIAFIIYLAGMILIGVAQMNKNNNAEDYFLGGRGLNGWVAALSAQASDMSGWLLMGLPGAVYAMGTGQSWIAIGLFIGTVFNWIFISGRLRRYTIVANNSLTLPEYFENRFHDKKRILLTISSVVIIIFFLVYTASALASGGKLFNSVFGVDYHMALMIGAAVILVYTFMGGFLAVCTTDFIQGTLMLICLMIVPIMAYMSLGSGNMTSLLDQSGVAGGSSAFLNLLSNGEKPYTAIDIISQLAWGLGYCGMPHILTRFMAVKNEKELKKSRGIAIIWVAISLGMACVIGVVGRAYLFPTVLGEEGTASAESVFIEMITKLFTKDFSLAFICGIFLCAILAAIMSTADSQLLVASSSVSKDIFKDILKPDADDKTVLRVSRITVAVVAILAFAIAWDPDSSIMALVSDAWAGLGSAFGPIVLLSLYWKRTNIAGAIAGMVSGALAVIIWDYIPCMNGQTPSAYTGLYSLALGFAISLVSIVIFSLCTKAPAEEIVKEFESVEKYTEEA
ncbi:MAG: sodium/proline symporter PutP [Lachnospiraceae bacterium]|nr:sodium/proline symporter PutP [Lachnospiraceae bacterium]